MSSASQSADPRADEVPRCEPHGTRTRLTCVDCGAPVCPKCMVRTEVGIKCETDAAPVPAPEGPTAAERGRRIRLAAGALVTGLVVLVGAAVFVTAGLRDTAEGPPPPADPVGQWQALPSLTAIRGSAAVVELADGSIAVIGGGVGAVPLAATEVLAAGADGWLQAADLATARRGHRAVVLPDGRVLVAGGIAEGTLLDATEVADPELLAWEAAPPTALPRLGHGLTVLPDGSVLLTGGTDGSAGPGDGGGRQSVRPVASAERLDPELQAWTPAGEMGDARFEHTATALPDGRVLLAGGLGIRDGEVVPLDTAEVYDPASGTFGRAAAMSSARANHAAALLPDGRVLVVGGAGSGAALGAAEVYDPQRNSWSDVASLRAAREGHIAITLDDGSVLVAGGEFFSQGSRRSLADAERFDPEADVWEPAGAMDCPRSEAGAGLLPDGTAVVVAGDAAFPGQPPQPQSCADRYLP